MSKKEVKKMVTSGEAICEEIYYARKRSVTFQVNVPDFEGQKQYEKNIMGTPTLVGGKPVRVTRAFKFRCIKKSHSQGHVSQFPVFDRLPKEMKNRAVDLDQYKLIKERLAQLAADGTTAIMTKDQFDKSENPRWFKEKEKNALLEAELQEMNKNRHVAVTEAVSDAVRTERVNSSKIITDLKKQLAETEKKLKK